MKDEITIAPKGARFLNEWKKKIPENCVLSKGVTGCGATQLAIWQPGDTILAMPYQTLVKNKLASNPELLGIHGDMDREKEIAKYIKEHETIKIATTYDSLPVVCNTLEALGRTPYSEMFLFVDEWHTLLNSYGFRHQAVNNLLAYSRKFDRKTFVSATPIEREYWLSELDGLPEYKIEWPDAETITVNSTKMEKPIEVMAYICKCRKAKGGEDHYHIFINSVQSISKIIRLAGIKPEECRVVCSQSDEDTKEKNEKKLPEGFSIQTTSDKVRLFNFYTATCFEGQDIYDSVGRTFIVSEGDKDHTKVDITTTLLQICGRVRDSKYRKEITQYYSTSSYKDISLEEFKASIQAELNAAEEAAAVFNQIPEGLRRDNLIKYTVKHDPYIIVRDGQFVADRNYANYKMVNYGVVNGQYRTQCNMNETILGTGANLASNEVGNVPEGALEELTSVTKTPFKDVFEEYCELRSRSNFYDLTLRTNRIEFEKPLVKSAYDILGPDRVRELKYHQGNIKRELAKVSHETFETKIFMIIKDQLPLGIAIPCTEIRKILQDAYTRLGSKQKPKATDIKKWYYYKKTTKRVDKGKPVASFAIISAKYKVPKA